MRPHTLSERIVGNPAVADAEQPMRPGGTDETRLGTFAPHVYSRLVLAQRDEAGAAQVRVGGPFDEFKLTDKNRLQPSAFLHLGSR